MLPQVKVLLARDMGPRTWGEELLIAESPHYIGKLMRMTAGAAGGLQFHRDKDETSFLLSGLAWVYTDTGDGVLKRFKMTPGTSVHIPPGAIHKVEAIEDCVFMECSTPHFDDRVRVEARYGLPDVGGLQTTRSVPGESPK